MRGHAQRAEGWVERSMMPLKWRGDERMRSRLSLRGRERATFIDVNSSHIINSI